MSVSMPDEKTLGLNVEFMRCWQLRQRPGQRWSNSSISVREQLSATIMMTDVENSENFTLLDTHPGVD